MRHGNIKNHHVWLCRLRLLHRDAPIRCFSDYCESRLALQQQPQTPAHDIMIIR
jgi:hypothetical protein